MRINNYNKFFAEVAKIMSTDVKAVKQLEGRYKVELVNHVYLNVYRGVSGSLFVHDHRGIAHITSVYDFDDFKTIKDLYKRLVTDYSESEETVKSVMKHKGILNAQFGMNMNAIENLCPNRNTCCIESPFRRCDYKYKSDKCNEVHKAFIHDCKRYYNHIKAIQNPNWHHVSLNTLANIDIDMLDETRQLYMHVKYQLNTVIKAIYKCKRYTSIDILRNRLIQHVKSLARNRKVDYKLLYYVKAQIDNCYLVNGLISSTYADCYSNKASRAYKKYFYI